MYCIAPVFFFNLKESPMARNVYGFRQNRSIKNVNPQSIGDELERIRTDQGKLTPEVVVEAAADEASPLHAAFEWSDSEAARLHRLGQARSLIVSVRIISSPMLAKVPAYVSVRSPEVGRNYVPTHEALSDEEIRARVLQEIRQFAESMERRYAHFREVSDLIDRLKAQAG
jgi:hypothetical protein